MRKDALAAALRKKLMKASGRPGPVDEADLHRYILKAPDDAVIKAFAELYFGVEGTQTDGIEKVIRDARSADDFVKRWVLDRARLYFMEANMLGHDFRDTELEDMDDEGEGDTEFTGF